MIKDSFLATQGLLESWGKVLLLGSFGISLVRAMRGDLKLEVVFERVVIGIIFFSFYKSFGNGLESITKELTLQIKRLNPDEDLKELIIAGMKKAASTPNTNGVSGINVSEVFEQALRTGVWGVLNAVVEFLFILSELLIECAHAVFVKLALIIFPLSIGVFPILPKVMTNMMLYLVELSLWLPVLSIIRTTTAVVAKGYLEKSGSLGLYIIGVELVAILLMFMVPTISNRLLSGAFSGDFNTQNSVLSHGKKMLSLAKGKLA